MLSKAGWQREIFKKRGKLSHLSLTQLPFWIVYSSSYPVFAEQTLVHFETRRSLVGVTNPVDCIVLSLNTVQYCTKT